MFTIGICDDMEVFRSEIREICDRFFIKHQIPYQCFEFASGEEVLQYQGE